MLNAVEERNRKKIQQMENVKSLNDYNKNVIKYMKAVENEENIIEERKVHCIISSSLFPMNFVEFYSIYFCNQII